MRAYYALLLLVHIKGLFEQEGFTPQSDSLLVDLQEILRHFEPTAYEAAHTVATLPEGEILRTLAHTHLEEPLPPPRPSVFRDPQQGPKRALGHADRFHRQLTTGPYRNAPVVTRRVAPILTKCRQLLASASAG